MLTNKNFGDIVTFTRASARWRFSSGGVLVQDAANVPSLDYDPITLAARGLLVEDSRTNVIRNNSCVGAVAGTPGTAPTNWVLSAASGLAWSVVGIGSEDGIPFVDLRLQGTASAVSYNSVSFDTASPAASVGQTWSIGAYVKLIAGSFANVGYAAAEGLRVAEYDAAPAYLGSTGSDIRTVALGANLRGNRVAHTRTVAVAGAATVRPQLQFPVASGGVVDMTLRIGAPQFELGVFPTSPILTTNTQVTRAVDYAIVTDLSKIAFNASEGTIYLEAVAPAGLRTDGGSQFCIGLDDNGFNNAISIGRSAARAFRAQIKSNNVDQGAMISGTWADNTNARVALAYSASGASLCWNGGAPVSTPGAVSVPPLSRLRLGTNIIDGSAVWNSAIRNLRYFPRRLSATELQNLTA